MKILALDIATHCGWAISNGIYGEWDLRPKRDESSGMRLIRFKSKLKEIIETESINLIVFERPGGIHRGAIIVQSELQGILKEYCEEKKIEYKGYSSMEIKKFATGKGNCKKDLMIEFARKKYNYQGDNDNEADALHLLNLAKKDLFL